jgi:alkaline phosphatase D
MHTILQLTDAHLSPRNEFFRSNVALIHALAAATPPDLTVASGDLSLDGADHEADMAFAAEELGRFPGPILALPGNHDTGSHPHTMPRQPFDGTRLARFQRHLGAGFGLHDLPGWRVIGLNSEVMGTGHPEEDAQARFISEALESAEARRLAVFLHKPIFITHPDDPVFDYWSVPPHARHTLMPLLEHPGLRLVASGHLHLHHEFKRDAVSFVWAPPLSFVFEEDEQQGLPGARRCGALLHHLHEDHVETVLLEPNGMEVPYIGPIRHLTYPRATS